MNLPKSLVDLQCEWQRRRLEDFRHDKRQLYDVTRSTVSTTQPPVVHRYNKWLYLVNKIEAKAASESKTLSEAAHLMDNERNLLGLSVPKYYIHLKREDPTTCKKPRRNRTYAANSTNDSGGDLQGVTGVQL